MSLRRKLISSVAVLCLVGAAGAAIAQVKIATVDLHRAIMETEDGRRARRRLEGEFSNRQRELDAAQEELRRMQSELETQRNVLSRQALEQRMEAYQNRVIEVQRQYVEYQQELAQHESELTRTIVERMQTILREIGQADGYTVVLDTSGGAVLFAQESIDLTAVLIQRYNAQAPAVSTGGGMGSTASMGGTATMGSTSTMSSSTMMSSSMTSP